MSCSLNSLKGDIGDYIGESYGVITEIRGIKTMGHIASHPGTGW